MQNQYAKKKKKVGGFPDKRSFKRLSPTQEIPQDFNNIDEGDNSSYSFSFFSFYLFTTEDNPIIFEFFPSPLEKLILGCSPTFQIYLRNGGSDFKGFCSEEIITQDLCDLLCSSGIFPYENPPPPFYFFDGDTQVEFLNPFIIYFTLTWDHMDGRFFSYQPQFYTTPSILSNYKDIFESQDIDYFIITDKELN